MTPYTCVCPPPAVAHPGRGAGGDPCPEGDGAGAGEAHLRPGAQTLPVHQRHGLAPRPRAGRGLRPPEAGIKAESPQRAGGQSHVLSPGAKAAGKGAKLCPPTPPTPPPAPLSPGASLPPCSPGAKRRPGTSAPRGRGGPTSVPGASLPGDLRARSQHPPRTGGGSCPPIPPSHTLGYGATPPPPTPQLLFTGAPGVPPPIKGSASRGCGAGTGGRMGGPCPAPPLPARPQRGAERGREAPVQEHLLVSAAVGAAQGSPGPGPDVACGVRGGGAATKSPAGARPGAPAAPPCAKKEQPGAGRWGPGG